MSEATLAPTPSNTYSFSRIKCFQQCPLRYRFRYLEGRKEAFRSIESFLGSTVHDVLEWLYAQRDAGTDPDESAVLAEFARHWTEGRDRTVAIIRVNNDDEEYIRLGREMLARFFSETFTRDQSRTVSLEQRLSKRLSDAVLFTGFADRIGRTDKGRLFVIDYKTSKSEGDGSEFSEGLQAPLYAACVLDHHDDDEALAGYHYLRHGTTRWQQVDRDRARQLVDRFLELVSEVEAAGDFPARPGVLCAWCGFNAICPSAEVPDSFSGGLRRAEEMGRSLF
jgi:putative RecB family exonuclease